jgi:hypothetical protein
MSNTCLNRKKYACTTITKGVCRMDKKKSTNSSEIAGRIYDASDYQKNDTLSQGLATTHEQFSDSYMEGEVGGVMENVAGKNIPLSREIYEEE